MLLDNSYNNQAGTQPEMDTTFTNTCQTRQKASQTEVSQGKQISCAYWLPSNPGHYQLFCQEVNILISDTGKMELKPII